MYQLHEATFVMGSQENQCFDYQLPGEDPDFQIKLVFTVELGESKNRGLLKWNTLF